MRELPPLYYTSPRGQCAVMLLAALREILVIEGRGGASKREAIQYIAKKHWFAIEPEDLEPYKSQVWTTKEPRWNTLIAWARKDGVLRDLVSYQARDEWGLTRFGRSAIERFCEFCRAGQRPVLECFLWSPEFKRFLYPDWKLSSADLRRPSSFYRSEFSRELMKFAETS